MPRRSPRLLPLLLAPALAVSLAACGSNADNGAGNVGLDAVTVTGEFGKAANVEITERVDTTEFESTTLIAGDGAEVNDGDKIYAQLALANGFSREVVLKPYTKAEGTQWAQILPVSSEDTDTDIPAFAKALIGQKVGSRVAVVAPPADMYGEFGNPDLKIGNQDDVVLVIDIISKILPKAEGTTIQPSGQTPQVRLNDQGLPDGMTFQGLSKTPPKGLQVHQLIRGDGAKLVKGQPVSIRYRGQIWGKNTKFDSNYETGATLDISDAAPVVTGMSQALVGQPVGSRIVMVIPPALGYGDKAQGKDIPANSTLVFVVDIVGAG